MEGDSSAKIEAKCVFKADFESPSVGNLLSANSFYINIILAVEQLVCEIQSNEGVKMKSKNSKHENAGK